MKGRLITELEALTPEIEAAWRHAAEQRGNPFVTPEWFHAWWEHYGDDHRPAIVAGPQNLGFLPLVQPRGSRGMVRFAGASLGDCFDPAGAPECDDELAALAGEFLGQSGGGALVLDYCALDSTWPERLAGSMGRDVTLIEQRRANLPYAELPGTWEEFLSGRSAKFPKRLRRVERTLERDVDAEVTVREITDPGELDQGFDCFMDLHSRRWAERGGSSLSSPAAQSMHRSFARAALGRGWLRLRFLEVAGTPVAALYGWRLGNRYSYYQAGFAPEWGKYRVGLLLFAWTIRDAIGEGAEVFDMLLGEEGYKARFSTGVREVRTVAIVGSRRPLRVALAAEARMRRMGGGVASGSGPMARAARAVAARMPTGRES